MTLDGLKHYSTVTVLSLRSVLGKISVKDRLDSKVGIKMMVLEPCRIEKFGLIFRASIREARIANPLPNGKVLVTEAETAML